MNPKRSNKHARQFRKYANSLITPPTLSDQCVADYAIASVDPFNTDVRPCVPMFPAVPSHKSANKIREYTGRTSATTGTGFVLVRANPVSDLNDICFSSDSTYALNTMSVTLAETGTSVAAPNSGYTSAQLAPGELEFRCVSLGVRICFDDRLDELGGSVYTVHDDNGSSIQGFGTEDITDQPGHFVGKWSVGSPEDPNPLWYSALWAPALANDFAYKSAITSINYDTGILIQGPAVAGGLKFRIQLMEHWEWVGDIAPRGTPSHANSAKTEHVMAAIQNLPAHVTTMASNGGSFLDAAIAGIADFGSALVPNFLGNVLGSSLPELVGGVGPIVEDLTPGITSTALPLIEEIGEAVGPEAMLALLL